MNINKILKLAENYENNCLAIKTAVIKKLPSGLYRVLSEKGKNLGTYKSKDQAKKRLKQVEFFKYLSKIKKTAKVLDLSAIEDFSFSAIMRQLNNKADKSQVEDFLKEFKKCFDASVKNKLKEPDKVALRHAVYFFNEKYPINLNKNLKKEAAAVQLGAPEKVGKYLSDIVKFMLQRISAERRPNSINSLKKKFYSFNINELANKKLPASSSIGQSLTFVKHVLFNQQPQYIKSVLEHLIRNL